MNSLMLIIFTTTYDTNIVCITNIYNYVLSYNLIVNINYLQVFWLWKQPCDKSRWRSLCVTAIHHLIDCLSGSGRKPTNFFSKSEPILWRFALWYPPLTCCAGLLLNIFIQRLVRRERLITRALPNPIHVDEWEFTPQSGARVHYWEKTVILKEEFANFFYWPIWCP